MEGPLPSPFFTRGKMSITKHASPSTSLEAGALGEKGAEAGGAGEGGELALGDVLALELSEPVVVELAACCASAKASSPFERSISSPAATVDADSVTVSGGSMSPVPSGADGAGASEMSVMGPRTEG